MWNVSHAEDISCSQVPWNSPNSPCIKVSNIFFHDPQCWITFLCSESDCVVEMKWWVQIMHRLQPWCDRAATNCLSQLKLSPLIVVKQSLILRGSRRRATLMKRGLGLTLAMQKEGLLSARHHRLSRSTPTPKLPPHERPWHSPHTVDS